jgi:ATP-dependent Clp protease ATP-binding subunit ClpA
LARHGVTKAAISEALNNKTQDETQSMPEDEAKMLLAQFAVNLNRKAQQNKIDPLGICAADKRVTVFAAAP